MSQIRENINSQDKPPNFRGKDGNIYLVHCFVCGKENYAPAVAMGRCAWCGHDANLEDRLINIVNGDRT